MVDEDNSYRIFGGCCYGYVIVRYITKNKIKIITKNISHIFF